MEKPPSSTVFPRRKSHLLTLELLLVSGPSSLHVFGQQKTEENDRIEENDEHDAKIAGFTITTTMWINGESFVFCPAKNSVV